MNNILLAKITNIRTVTGSSKSCAFGSNGCTLESKFGNIVIDVSKYENVSHIVLHLRRLSGNGKVIIGGTEKTISSKISQDIETNEIVIEISRNSSCIGEISIFAISIYGHLKKEDTLGQNWKKLISRCGEYHCLRMTSGRLFAAQGAYVANGSVVTQIETVPPGMTRQEAGKLIFLGPCEITSLEIDESAPVIPSSTTELYVQREPAGPVFEPSVPLPPPPPTQTLTQLSPGKSKLKPVIAQLMHHFIYDSTSVNEFTSVNKHSTKTVKFVQGNGTNCMLLRRTGSYSISIPNLTVDSESQYVIVVMAKKLNGNGRLSLFLDPAKEEILTIDGQLREHSLLVKPEHLTTPQLLRLTAGVNSSGEILISRVRVVKMPLNSNFSHSSLHNINYGTEVIQPISWLPSRRRFVIVIPSYKNVQYCERNILSTINQNYDLYRVIFTDDASPDSTFEKVQSIVDQSAKKDKFTLIKNSTRIGALANLYNMIHSCDDDEIVLTLDGDDWLAHENVLSKLNEVYFNGDVWITYGQYQNHPDGGRGVASPIPNNITANNAFRDYTWCASHLRTFCAWLFKNIRVEDLMYQQSFMSMTWDMAMMFPMLEMAGNKSRFIPDILYTYNLENPINDHKVNVQLQQHLDRYVRKLPRYSPLKNPSVKRNQLGDVNVGLLLLATGKYTSFAQGLISSADNYFLNESNLNVTYYVFTDKDISITSQRNVIPIRIDHRPFPFASMDRFKHFTQNATKIQGQDYLFYVDVDSLFVNYVSREILGNLVGVRHCGFYKGNGPYESNPASGFYVNSTYPKQYKYYFGGGFSGGKTATYLAMAAKLDEMIDADVARSVIPLWHDETAINRYFLDNEPDVILSPSYHYPQDNIERYKQIWAPDVFQPKILLLTKNHAAMR